MCCNFRLACRFTELDPIVPTSVSGETVIVNPITLMSEEEQKAKFGDPPRVALPKRSPIPAIPPKKGR
jgi:hypothetical protein